jgi:hypothetical protein
MTASREEEMRRSPLHGALVEPSVVVDVARVPAGLLVGVLVPVGQAWALAMALAVILLVAAWHASPLATRWRAALAGEMRLVEPLTGSLYRLTVFAAFLAAGWFPAWALVLLFGRELVVPYARAAVRQRGRDLPARTSDAWLFFTHCAVQAGLGALVLAAGGASTAEPGVSGAALATVAVAASVWSFADHVAEASRLTRS